MKIDLDDRDLKMISKAQKFFSDDDTTPDILYHGFNRLVRKINSQIPDPTPVGATRRIRTFSK